MERDGISKCWTIKVRIKSPTTSTDAMPAIDSGNVSFGRSGFSRFLLNNGKDIFLNWINAPDETCGSSGFHQKNESPHEPESQHDLLRRCARIGLWVYQMTSK